jgi:hypothetical protein
MNPGVPQVFRGAVVRLDRNQESLAFVEPGAVGAYGDTSYDCTNGFGFEGEILAGFEPEGRPISTPPGSAIKIPAGALIVYEIHYHAHYANPNPGVVDPDAGPPPDVLTWEDHTSLSLRWEDSAALDVVATVLTFGNYNEDVVDGTGSLTGELLVPADTAGHVESMVKLVPGPPSDAYAVWAVQPEMMGTGTTASVSVTYAASSENVCLAAIPRWDAGWQIPLTFDTSAQAAPIVYGGDRLQIDCRYTNTTNDVLLLGEESCRTMVGLVPIE